MTFGRSSTTPQQAPQNEPFVALLHQPLFGTSLPAAEPSQPHVEALAPPSPLAAAPYPERDTPVQEPPSDRIAAVVEPTLRLAGADPSVRPAQNSLLRERVPIVLPARAKRRRRPFRFLLKLVLVLAFFAAVAAAVWYVVLPRLHRVEWQGDVQPIAEEVAATRGLTWDHPIEVVPLDQLEYGRMLARSTLGVSADSDVAAGEWRAMGLAEGSVDLGAVGAEASADRPAFFDTQDDVIYAVASLDDPLRTLALRRALGEALLAQQPGTSSEAPGSSAALAARLLAEADAAATAQSALLDQATRETVASQRGSLLAPVPDPSRYPIDLMVGDAGVTRLFEGSADPAARAALVGLRPPSDAALLDVARPVSSLPAAVSIGDGVQRGMIYWYYVLASRLPAGQAWQAATAWNGDEVVVKDVDAADGRVCVTASIAAVDASGRDALLAALSQWSAAAPPDAGTTVAVDGDLIGVSSCDPGSQADTITSMATPFGDAAIEISLMSDLDAMPDSVRRCIVGAVRMFGVAGLVRAGDQDGTDAAMSDIRNACGA